MMGKRGRPTAGQPTSQNFKVCSNCFAKIYRGSTHSSSSCKFSRRAKIDNIEELVKSPSSLERLALRTIYKSSDTVLSTLGNKGKQVGQTIPRKVLFNKEDMIGIQQDLQLSNKQVKVLAQDLRICTDSRKSVESNLREKLHEANHQLDEFFEVRQLVYRREDKEKKIEENFHQTTIVCSNLSGLIGVILEKRQRMEEDSLLIRIGIDSGGGFLKICLSVFHIDDPYSKSNSLMSKKFKESGVKRVFLLGLVPDVSERCVELWIRKSR